MQADFVDEPGQVHPAAHRFARTPWVDDGFHNRVAQLSEGL
jgi:hypothetical protein